MIHHSSRQNGFSGKNTNKVSQQIINDKIQIVNILAIFPGLLILKLMQFDK